MLANEWDISELIAAGFSEADLTGIDAVADAENDKTPSGPAATLAFPPRVWLMQRGEIIAALQPIIEGYGGQAEWPE